MTDIKIDRDSLNKCSTSLHVFGLRKGGNPDYHLEIYYNTETGVITTIKQRNVVHEETMVEDGSIKVCEIHDVAEARTNRVIEKIYETMEDNS